MGVEICQSAVAFFGTDLVLPETAHSFTQTYGPPILGIGIGPAGNSGQSGSLSFYLKVEYQGNMDIFAITCHHVVAPGICLLSHPPRSFSLSLLTRDWQTTKLLFPALRILLR
jgi:hypothetical protein